MDYYLFRHLGGEIIYAATLAGRQHTDTARATLRHDDASPRRYLASRLPRIFLILRKFRARFARSSHRFVSRKHTGHARYHAVTSRRRAGHAFIFPRDDRHGRRRL